MLFKGNLVELVAGPVVRNRFTRLVAFIPFWLFQRGPPKWCLVRTQRIAGIKCRMYLPQGATRRSNAAIVFIHGGGWCMGRPRFYDGSLLRIIKKLGLPIVSIDYSLSPEVKFPSALLECERVMEELYKINFNEIGVDGSKVALMGDSAGGNVCAVLCQRAMRRHRTSGNNALMPKCHILVYPVIHMLDFQSPSYLYYYQSYRGTGLLNPTMLIRWYLLYLGIEPTRENIRIMATNRHLSKELREDKKLMGLVDHSLLPRELPGHKWQLAQEKKQNGIETSPRIETNSKTSFPLCLPVICQNNNNKVADVNVLKEGQKERDVMANRMAQLLRNPDLCPVIADDLHDVCPALICTAGIDILRDEGILYAQRLSHFGVPVDWKHYESAYHGILNMGKSAKRAQILNDICDYLQKNLL